MINFTLFADLRFWLWEYFLMIWPDSIDFKPMCLTSFGEKDPETESESDIDKESRTGGTERIVENSWKDSEEVKKRLIAKMKDGKRRNEGQKRHFFVQEVDSSRVFEFDVWYRTQQPFVPCLIPLQNFDCAWLYRSVSSRLLLQGQFFLINIFMNSCSNA